MQDGPAPSTTMMYNRQSLGSRETRALSGIKEDKEDKDGLDSSTCSWERLLNDSLPALL
jgi:hypothetical protein